VKTLVIGDFETLYGTDAKPGKIAWLKERGIAIHGVQVISLIDDLKPANLVNLFEKLKKLTELGLERISVALLCWPKVKTVVAGKTTEVAASTFLTEDLYSYALGVCIALQKLSRHVSMVDISYHPMLTVPKEFVVMIDPIWHQKFLLNSELTRRNEFRLLMAHYNFDIAISIENEPMTSDRWGNLVHTGNRLWSESVDQLPEGWGVTADIQHCAMALHCANNPNFHWDFPLKDSAAKATWEAQFQALRRVTGPLTFHISQMVDPVLHISPPLDFSNALMDWGKITTLLRKLDQERKGNVWYGIEIDGGHIYPEGYEQELVSLKISRKEPYQLK